MNTDALTEIETQTLAAIAAADTRAELDAARVGALGKKGRLSELMRTLAQLDAAELPAAGKRLNAVRDVLNAAIDERAQDIHRREREDALQREHCDMSLPPRPEPIGCLHPVMRVSDEILAIFAAMGFATVEGPDIEDDFHNFTALNFSATHPSRDARDTFFLGGGTDGLVLRTHTSPMQVRTMMTSTPPIRIVVPGRVYRRDWDATHTPMFHQIEGLVIDRGSHMGHLKSCLDSFLSIFFAQEIKSRFRPHFFPFTEPSAEMDVRCSRDGAAVRIGSGDEWMEILGCGMVHPNVLRACSLNPDEYQGYAFGLGVDRLAMLKYGMADLRAFFTGDMDWSRVYGFSPFAADR